MVAHKRQVNELKRTKNNKKSKLNMQKTHENKT